MATLIPNHRYRSTNHQGEVIEFILREDNGALGLEQDGEILEWYGSEGELMDASGAAKMIRLDKVVPRRFDY